MKGVNHLVNSAHGIYVPQVFVKYAEAYGWIIPPHHSDDVASIEEGPESEYYWESWESLLSMPSRVDEEGNRWTLHQDGDLFEVCDDLLSDEEYEIFWGEPREEK